MHIHACMCVNTGVQVQSIRSGVFLYYSLSCILRKVLLLLLFICLFCFLLNPELTDSERIVSHLALGIPCWVPAYWNYRWPPCLPVIWHLPGFWGSEIRSITHCVISLAHVLIFIIRIRSFKDLFSGKELFLLF